MKKNISIILSTIGYVSFNQAMATNNILYEDQDIKAVEQRCFEKKDNQFWIINNHQNFMAASEKLISDNGQWLGIKPIPSYIKYTGELTEIDLPILEKWLKIKDLKCFGLADQKKQGPIQLIDSWYDKLLEQKINPDEHGIYKVAWLNYNSTLRQIELKDSAELPFQWIETNRDYLMKNSHYRDYNAPIQLSW